MAGASCAGSSTSACSRDASDLDMSRSRGDPVNARETDAVRARYERRRSDVEPDRYSPLRPDVWQSFQERERAMLRTFWQWVVQDSSQYRLVEVGCGAGANLLEFLRLGFAPEHLLGIELLERQSGNGQKVFPAGLGPTRRCVRGRDPSCHAGCRIPGNGVFVAIGRHFPGAPCEHDVELGATRRRRARVTTSSTITLEIQTCGECLSGVSGNSFRRDAESETSHPGATDCQAGLSNPPLSLSSLRCVSIPQDDVICWIEKAEDRR